MGGLGGLTDQERNELEVEFERLEAEIEDLKMARDSPGRREQINQKTARLQVISVGRGPVVLLIESLGIPRLFL